MARHRTNLNQIKARQSYYIGDKPIKHIADDALWYNN